VLAGLPPLRYGGVAHIFVTSVTLHAARHLSLESAPAFAVLVLGLLAITVVGCLTYEFIEKPITKFAQRLVFGAAVRPSPEMFGARLRVRS
jgi:peptidoglycan/LPS O-acetylase OafA/YrhL